MDTKNPSIDIVFKDIKYSVKDKASGKMLNILNGISGQVKAGQCLGIMGASGSGKTTLLNILSGRIIKDKNNELSGQVLYNGKHYELNQLNTFSGYVQ